SRQLRVGAQGEEGVLKGREWPLVQEPREHRDELDLDRLEATERRPAADVLSGRDGRPDVSAEVDPLRDGTHEVNLRLWDLGLRDLRDEALEHLPALTPDADADEEVPDDDRFAWHIHAVAAKRPLQPELHELQHEPHPGAVALPGNDQAEERVRRSAP